LTVLLSILRAPKGSIRWQLRSFPTVVGSSRPLVLATMMLWSMRRPAFYTSIRIRDPRCAIGRRAFALLGRIEEPRKVGGRLLEARPDYSITEVRRHHEFDLNRPFRKPGVTECLYRGLRLSGPPE
jgi:hypothetical protein